MRLAADVGLLKPETANYRRLLNDYGLEADRSVFIDDKPRNAAGAQDVRMRAICFIDAAKCESDLLQLGLGSESLTLE